jgi:hypothetical protein
MMEITDSLKVAGYVLENPDKINRALNGSPNAQGVFVGGVLKGDGTYDDAALLAEYDRIGGYMTKGGDKVRTGSFFDFQNKKARVDAKVELEFRVNGEVVYVPAEKEKPAVVKAAAAVKKAAKKTTKKAAKKVSK